MTCIKKKEPDAIIELIWPAAKYTPEPSGFLETITFVVVNIIYSKKTKNKWQFRSLMICQWIHKGVSLLNLKSYKKEKEKKKWTMIVKVAFEQRMVRLIITEPNRS